SLQQLNVPVILLLHETKKDTRFVQLIENAVGSTFHVFASDDPVVLKGVLGNALGVVSSRFHALISALSQGVPSIGTSWSHKYEALFRDYDCSEMLISPSSDEEFVRSMVIELCDEDQNERRRARLRERASVIRADVDRMFAEVLEAIS